MDESIGKLHGLNCVFAQKRRCAIWNVICGIWLLGAVIVDLNTYRIPNRLSFWMAGNGLLMQGYTHGVKGLLEGGCGMFVGIAIVFVFFYIRVLGAGDVKLIGAVGAFVGNNIWMVLRYTCLMAGIFAALRMAYTEYLCRNKSYLERQEIQKCGRKMHMSVPIFLGVFESVIGGMGIGV